MVDVHIRHIKVQSMQALINNNETFDVYMFYI